MKVGDLIAYAHDREKVGMIIKVSPERERDNLKDTLLVLWSKPTITNKGKSKQQWYVAPEWCVMVRSV